MDTTALSFSLSREALAFYAKTVALALLSSCLIIVPTVGCKSLTQVEVDKVLDRIANEIPMAESAAAIVTTAIEVMDPALVIPITAGMAIINPGLTELKTLILAYTANPGASTMARIQELINSIVTNGSAALFSAAHITDKQTQARIVALLNSLMAPLLFIDSFIQTVESRETLKAHAASRTVKLSMIDPYLDRGNLNSIAVANGSTYSAFYSAETRAGY